jgi:NAD(P)-dependent dehydrogenase (short-subunit alcohol dehydrogenase family)
MNERALIKKVLITGGTSGLGYELVKRFLDDGAEVYATGRKIPEALSGNNRFHFVQVDFSDLKQVEPVISEISAEKPEFDLVINNAGVLSPSDYRTSKNGIEYTFQVNFLAHLLIDDIIVRSHSGSKELKIAFVTSPVYRYVKPLFRFPEENGYRPFRTYCETKYYLLLVGSYLTARYPEKDIKIIGLDPGIFSSGIYRMQKQWFHKMYTIGAHFMRSSGKVASDLHRILISMDAAWNKIYHRSGRKVKPFPLQDDISGKFLLSCQEAIKIMR